MKPSPESTEVLISGAGPTGLMLALLLAQQNIKCRIFDLNQGRAKESRAAVLWPKSLELFDRIGLVDRFLAKGRVVHDLKAYIDGRDFAHISFADIGREDTPYPYIFILSQSDSEQILEAALLDWGVRVERETVLDTFTVKDSVVQVRLRHADGSLEETQAHYLVGCDGARSQVRKVLGLEFKGGTYDAEFQLADGHVQWDLPQDRVQLFLGRHSIGLFFPMKGGDISRVIALKQNRRGLARIGENLITEEPLTLAELQKNFAEAVQHPVQIEHPIWQSRYRVHHRGTEHMQVGPVFLAGDAAHIHSPVGAQGMNTGLQDAENLAWKIASVLREETSPDILKTYHEERWPVGQKILHFTDRLFMVAILFGPFLASLRNLLFSFVGRFVLGRRSGRKRLFDFVSQLNIHYHGNAAVEESLGSHRDKSRVLPGRRAADAKLKDGRSLFDLIRGYKFTLLVMSASPLDEKRRRDFERRWRQTKRLGCKAEIHWIDSQTGPEALARYQVKDVLISLIRPDGYIGFQSDQLD